MLFENGGTFFERGASGGDIVDEPEGFSLKRAFFAFDDGESVFQVVETFFARFCFHLGLGVAGTEEHIGENWELQSGGEEWCECSCEKLGLIETTKAQTSPMEWDSDESIGKCQGIFLDGVSKERSKWKSYIGDKAILVGMDSTGEDGVAIVGSDENTIKCR